MNQSQQPQWFQKTIQLKEVRRGCHLVTDQIIREISSELKNIKIGLAHFFIQHTSASLTINENYDSNVPLDFEDSLNKIVPEGDNIYRY
jgi:secondary thiamine-phosphate synthase enzyme